ncbi:MAG: 1,6-anhydro-N-acetylmuramyl-L-alanine amidase AmpD [Mariprofundaceae bacterium]|nr:1,6-anhydro-N-acetylmuramyl-L-alanine amidase AmpD [Mariprofundaceae bacterium]
MPKQRPVRFLASPHHDARPDAADVDLIVLHAISLPDGEFGMDHVEALFSGHLDTQAHASFAGLAGLRVSAHFVVDRAGRITQFVPLDQRAWHAGVSRWQGREGCNDYSVGIEMLGDERRAFTVAQYRETARLCRALLLRLPKVSRQRIVGHQDVAPGRKWDPGRQWDWTHFRRSLGHIGNVDMDIR